jgi:IS30 family transposase
MAHTQIRNPERHWIECLLNQGYSLRAVARALHRSPSSIHDELRRNRVRSTYDAAKANQKARVRRRNAKHQCLRGNDPRVRRFITAKLHERWSPEKIAGYLTQRCAYPITAKAIYKFVSVWCLESCLWRSWHTCKTPRQNWVRDPLKKSIETRPDADAGTWEADFIVSKRSTASLLVAVNRATRYAVVQQLPNRSYAQVSQAFKLLHETCHPRTLTVDNDLAFRGWRELERVVGCPLFFTHPYRSWEKPLVEQTNQLIRRFIPKGTNLRTVSQRTLNRLDRFLNHTPKQCLHFFTPYEKHYATFPN